MKTVWICVAVATFLSAPLLLRQLRNDAPGKDVKEIIGAYKEALNVQRHVIFRFSATGHKNDQGPRAGPGPRDRTWHASGENALDYPRIALRMNEWGQRKSKFRSEEKPLYHRSTFDGKEAWGYQLDRTRRDNPMFRNGSIRITIDNDPPAYNSANQWAATRQLLGYTSYAYGTKIVDYLDTATILRVRPENDSINGTECVAIEFESKLGRGTIWLAPEYGYNLAKADIVAVAGDVKFPRTGRRYPEGYRNHYLYQDVSFERIDGVWFPTSMTSRCEHEQPNWKSVRITQCKLTDIRLNPDLDALGVFSKADIEEGALAVYLGRSLPSTTLLYRWLGGRVVPVNDP